MSMKKYLTISSIVLALAVGLTAGYIIGYDRAYEKINKPVKENPTEEASGNLQSDLQNSIWKYKPDSGQNIVYQYPDKLITKYIHTTEEWPPTVTIESGNLSCATEPVKVGTNNYCVKTTSEGAAGSTYKTYIYTRNASGQNKTVTLKFTLRYPQCANYVDEEVSLCEKENKNFDVNSLADRISMSVRFNSTTPPTDVSLQASLSGEYVCLPHKNTEGTQTMECAFGIKTASGSYYALDTTNLMDTTIMTLPTNTKINVDGLLTPIQMLSSNQWQKYNIQGIISAYFISVN